MILRGSATVTYSAALDTSRWALVARASTHEEALELLADYEREEELRRSAYRALFANATYIPGPWGTKL